MNAVELEQNKALTKHVVHDLNVSPILPFNDNAFDCAVCTASVEYLIHPFEVFREVARCVKPSGTFIVTFSDRWFPPKAIQLWSALHLFERVALVTEYFKQAGSFSRINTLSIQHYPRPKDDKYSNQVLYSDPVFAVWAKVD
jgi:ubiquinone/menaquinone biosynthesis C-methylase UbiE